MAYVALSRIRTVELAAVQKWNLISSKVEPRGFSSCSVDGAGSPVV